MAFSGSTLSTKNLVEFGSASICRIAKFFRLFKIPMKRGQTTVSRTIFRQRKVICIWKTVVWLRKSKTIEFQGTEKVLILLNRYNKLGFLLGVCNLFLQR